MTDEKSRKILEERRKSRESDARIKEFAKAVRPLMKFLAANYGIHATCRVTAVSAEITQDLVGYYAEDFVKD